METSMKKIQWAAAALLSLVLLASLGCQNKSTNTNSGSGSDVGEIQVVLGADTINFLPGDSASTSVKIYVRDKQGTVMPNVRVNVSLADYSLGFLDRVTPTRGDTTDINGLLDMTYRTYGQDGENQVTAAVGGLSHSQRLVVRRSNQTVSTLNLNLDRTLLSVSPSSEDSVQVRLTISDNQARPIVGIQLPLSATGGRIKTPPLTDTSGVAVTWWYSNYQFGTFNILVRAGGKRDSADVQVIIASSVRGTLTITTDTRRIKADNGVTVAVIHATLRDEYGQAIIGDTVRFGTPPRRLGTDPIGSVNGYGVTSSYGITPDTIFFKGGTIPCDIDPETLICDSAIVVARYYKPGGWNLADTVRICVEEASPIGTVFISANPTSGIAGVDSASIVAQVRYVDGGLVDGYWMRFVSSCGSFTYDSVLVIDGILSTDYNYWKYCNQIPALNDTIGARIYAIVAGVQSNPITFVVRAGAARKVEIAADPDVVLINETSMITATVKDSLNNKVGVGEIVSFTTTSGNLSAPTSPTDINGEAMVVFSSGTQAGQAFVKAALVGIAEDSTAVSVLPGFANTITLNVSSTSLVVAGIGGVDWTELQATVYDANGNPVPNGQWVTFEIIDAPGNCEINNNGTIDSSQTNNGLAVATFNAGTVPGPVEVEARTYRIVNDTTVVEIRARKSNISIVSGPPVNIDVMASEVATEAGGSAWDLEVSAVVSDAYLNPVQCGIAVFFELNPDTAQILSENVATCNDDMNGDSRLGVAYTTLRFLSPATFQTVFITARTAGQSAVEETIPFILPLQSPTIELNCTPLAWHFRERPDPYSKINCLAVVKDGHETLINGATVIYTSTRGIFFPTATGGIEIPQGQRITGTPPNMPGEAVAWLRGYEAYVFPDPLIPEITGEVSVTVLHYPVANDGVIVLFQR
jgi:adhesin/invasin